MKRNYFVLLVASLLVIIFIILIGVRERSQFTTQFTPTPQTGGLKEFKSSEVLDFTVMVPVNYTVTERFVTVSIISPDGKIEVGRNGTNFENLEEYLENFDSRRTLEAKDEKELTIDGYEAVSRIVIYPKEEVTQKSYYIYVNGAVYIFSTGDIQLYDDLDQIAQSFRYTP